MPTGPQKVMLWAYSRCPEFGTVLHVGSPSSHLRRWVDAGLIDADAAARIEAWESAQAPEKAAESRPGAMEALLYLGIVVLAAGAFTLLAQGWDQLEPWARVAALGVPFVLLLGAGGAMRQSADAELRRGSQAAWFVSVGLFAGLLAVGVEEFGPGISDNADAAMVIAAATLLFASALWVLSPTHAQVLAVAGSAAFLAETIGSFPDDYSPRYSGTAMFVAGAVGLALAEAGWLTPRMSARLCFAVLLVLGPYQAGVGGPIGFEFLAGAAAVAVIALGVMRGEFALVLAGVGGAFLVLITFIFEHFEDRLGAPLALMVSGGVLVAGVLILGLLRGQTRRLRAR